MQTRAEAEPKSNISRFALCFTTIAVKSNEEKAILERNLLKAAEKEREEKKLEKYENKKEKSLKKMPLDMHQKKKIVRKHCDPKK